MTKMVKIKNREESMPEKYVIVGNGFDINLGIKSAYSDFMSKVGEVHRFQTDADYKSYNALFQKDALGKWSDFESEFEGLIFEVNKIENEQIAIDCISQYNTDLQRLEREFYDYLLAEYRRWKQERSGTINPVYQSIFTDATVLSFNYTDSLTELGLSSQAKQVYQLHGSLASRNIIFGGGFLEHKKVAEIRYPTSTLNEKLVRIKKDHVLTSEREVLRKNLAKDDEIDVYILGHAVAGSDLNFLSHVLRKARKIYLFYYGEDYASKMQVLITEFGRDMLEKVELVPFVDVQMPERQVALQFNLVDSALSDGERGEKELKILKELFNLNIPATKEFEKIWITENSLNPKDIRSILLKSSEDMSILEWLLKSFEVGDEEFFFPIEIENIGANDVGFQTLEVSPVFSNFLAKASEIRIRNSHFFVDDLFEKLKGGKCQTINIWDSQLRTEKSFIRLSELPSLKELEIINSSFDGELLQECGEVFKILADKSIKVNVDNDDFIIYPEEEEEQ